MGIRRMGRFICLFTCDGGVTFNVEKGNDTELVYDEVTKVVYYLFYSYGQTTVSCLYPYTSKEGDPSYFSPYISENGKFCRFIDNKIVEIG